MWLALEHPEIPSCADCQRWLYDLPHWRRAERGGQPQPRGSAPTPCVQCPKSKMGPAPGRPNPGAELTGRNAQTWELYLAVQAGYPCPEDPIVRRNFALIRWTESEAERSRFDVRSLVRGLCASLRG